MANAMKENSKRNSVCGSQVKIETSFKTVSQKTCVDIFSEISQGLLS